MSALSVPEQELVGRERELRALDDLVADVRGERRVQVLAQHRQHGRPVPRRALGQRPSGQHTAPG